MEKSLFFGKSQVNVKRRKFVDEDFAGESKRKFHFDL